MLPWKVRFYDSFVSCWRAFESFSFRIRKYTSIIGNKTRRSSRPRAAALLWIHTGMKQRRIYETRAEDKMMFRGLLAWWKHYGKRLASQSTSLPARLSTEYTCVLCGFALQNAHILRFFRNSVVFCHTIWYNTRNTILRGKFCRFAAAFAKWEWKNKKGTADAVLAAVLWWLWVYAALQ